VLVCHCHRISDRTVKLCVRGGASTADDVGRSCGAGTACGGCRPAIEAIVRGLRLASGAANDDGEQSATDPSFARIASNG
jgi:bacterioferritin-associated ferredoxin